MSLVNKYKSRRLTAFAFAEKSIGNNQYDENCKALSRKLKQQAEGYKRVTSKSINYIEKEKS